MLHTTTGHLPNTGSVADQKLQLKYTGALAAGGPLADIRLSFVDATENSVTVNSIATPQPCVEANIATAAPHASGKYSGALVVANGEKRFPVDTTVLHTGTISGVDLTKRYFALCYSSDTGSSWSDSGIRVSVGKLQHILYGTPVDAPYEPRVMRPVLGTMLPSGLASAQNVILQAYAPLTLIITS